MGSLSILSRLSTHVVAICWDDLLGCRQDLLEATHKGPVKPEVTQWVMRESDISGNGLLSGAHQGGTKDLEWGSTKLGDGEINIHKHGDLGMVS